MPVNPWDAAMRGGWLHTRDHGSCAIEPRNIRASVWFARGSAHYQLQTEASLCDILVSIASHCLAGDGVGAGDDGEGTVDAAVAVDATVAVDAHVDVRATSSCISFSGPSSAVGAAWKRLVSLSLHDADFNAAIEPSPRVSHTHHAPRHWLADAAVRTGIKQWTAEALPNATPLDDNTLSHQVLADLFGSGVARLCTLTGPDAPEELNLASLSNEASTDTDDAASASVLRNTVLGAGSGKSGNPQRAGVFAMKPSRVAFTALLPHSETGLAAAHAIRTQLAAYFAEQASGGVELELTALGGTLGVTALTPHPVSDVQRGQMVARAFAHPSDALLTEAIEAIQPANEHATSPAFSPERVFSSRPFEPEVRADAVAKVVGMARKTVHLPWSETTAPHGWEWIVPPLHIDAFPTEYRGWDTDVLATIGKDTFAVARMAPGSTNQVESLHGLSTTIPCVVLGDEAGPHTWVDSAMRSVVCAPETFHGQLREDLDKIFARAPRLKAPSPDAVVAARAHAAQGRRRRKRALIGGGAGVIALSAACVIGLLTLT